MLNKKELKKFAAAGFIIAGIILSAAAKADAAWGDLDTSFGSNGTVQETETGYSVADTAIQPDGKILVTGCKLTTSGKKRFYLRRYLVNGEIDTAFGNNGSASVGGVVYSAYDYCGLHIKMMTNSKIGVLGYGRDKNAFWLVNSDGKGNTSFGSGGFVSLDNYPLDTYLNARLSVSGGTPVIGFYDLNTDRVMLINLTAAGAEDTTYGVNGKSYVYLHSSSNLTRSFEMVSDSSTGKTTIGGITQVTSGTNIRLTRKYSNGDTDNSFYSGLYPASHPISRFSGIGQLSNGKYVHTYFNADGVNFTGTLTRTDTNGYLDAQVNCGATCKLIGVQPDGKIVVEQGYFISRFDLNLNGLGSFVISDKLAGIEYPQYAFQPSSKMIVAGIKNNLLTIVRLNAN